MGETILRLTPDFLRKREAYNAINSGYHMVLKTDGVDEELF
jgi:hypothetical protein